LFRDVEPTRRIGSKRAGGFWGESKMEVTTGRGWTHGFNGKEKPATERSEGVQI